MTATVRLGDLRLFWRPLSILTVTSLLIAASCALAALDQLAGRSGSLLIAAAYALTIGAAVGSALQDVQHSTFAWTLPRLPKRLLRSTALVGLATVLMIVPIVLAGSAGTPTRDAAPWHVHVALTAAAYAFGLVFIDPLSNHRALVHFVIVGLAIVYLEPLASFAASTPLPTTALLVATLPFTIHRALGSRVFRHKPHVPTFLLLRGLSLAHSKTYAAERLGQQGPRGGDFGRTPIDRRLLGWAGAVCHETLGVRRYGAVGLVVLMSLLFSAFVVGFSYFDASTRSLADVAREIHGTVFQPLPDATSASGRSSSYNSRTNFVILFVVLATTSQPFGFRGGIPYPLSRRERARATGNAHALYYAVLFAIPCLTVMALACAISWIAETPLLPSIPRFVITALWVYACLPFVHAFRLKTVESNLSPSGFLIPIMIVLTILVTILTIAAPRVGIPPVVELAVVSGIALTGLFAHRNWLYGYFARADLT